MKPIQLLLAFTVFLTLLASKCKEPPPDPCPTHTDTKTLPPKTECGANNFGCLINGEVWVPHLAQNTPGIKKLHAEWYNGAFVLTAKIKTSQKYETMGIDIDEGVFSEGDYPLINDRYASSTIMFWDQVKNCFYDENPDYGGGLLTITKFDRENFIISGTFEYTLITDNCDTMRVTNGRFDVRE